MDKRLPISVLTETFIWDHCPPCCKSRQSSPTPMCSSSVPSRADVIAACERNGHRTNSLSYSQEIWIKYRSGVAGAEALMQQFVHQNADPEILYTPAVYDYFTEPQGKAPPKTYIVMERVGGLIPAQYTKATPDEADAILENIVAAIRHLHALPLPQGTSTGPLNGQEAVDSFFSEYGVDRAFDTIELEAWVTDHLEDAGEEARVGLRHSRCYICHCDLAYHVLYDNRVVTIDWGMTGICPLEFEEFGLVRQFLNKGGKFVKQLHKKLFGDRPLPSMRPMMIVSNINAFGCLFG